MANIAGIMELYTAYFNRAADKDGVDYWAKEMDTKGWTLDDVANSFAQQKEYTALYAGKTNAEIVELVYNNVLNRDADTEGAAYWLAELDSGAVTVSQFIQAVVNAATEMVDGVYKNPKDAAIVNNKTAVSQYAYDENSNAKNISLAGVTEDEASTQSAKTSIDAYVAAANKGQTYELTSGTDKGAAFVGTDKNDFFDASIAQNSFTGGVSNTLSSADNLDGGAGTDTLHAEIVAEFVGATTDYQIDVQPKTKDIEIVTFEARDSGSNDTKTVTIKDEHGDITGTEEISANSIVTVDAKYMTGLDKIGSKFSDGDLVIENLTTLDDNGNARNTEELTITMDHTDNFNSDTDASDLTVYFDEDYLLAGQSATISQANYWLLDEESDDYVTQPLLNIERNGVSLTIDGVVYVIAMDTDTAAGRDTWESFAAGLQAVIDASDEPAFDGLSVVVDWGNTDSTFNDNGVNVTIPAITIIDSNSRDLVPIGFVTPENATGKFDIYGDFDNVESVQTDKPVTINVELEKVGREGQGGNLIIGGKELDDTEGNGIDTFNISVLGDESKLSNLGTILSTNDALRVVNIASEARTDNSYASLTVRDAFGGTLDRLDANSFKGDLIIGEDTAASNIDAFTATGGGDVTLNETIDAKGNFTVITGNGADTLNIDLDGDAVDTVGTSFALNAGNGDNNVTVDMQGAGVSVATTADLDNLSITTGSGADKVTLIGGNNNAVDGDADFNIFTGSESDFVYINSIDDNDSADAAKGTWTVGTNTGASAQTVFYKAELTVDFAGFEQTVTINTTAANNFIATQVDINNAIIAAIAANPELARLLETELGTGTQELTINSTVEGDNELSITINQPTVITANTATALNPGEVRLVTADETALKTGLIATVTPAIDSDDVANEADLLTELNGVGTAVNGDADFVLNTATADGGSADETVVTNVSTIDLGTGSNDLVVLNSHATSVQTIEFSAAWGKVSVVNFETTGDTASDGTAPDDADTNLNVLDFSAWLDDTVDPSTGIPANSLSEVRVAETVTADLVSFGQNTVVVSDLTTLDNAFDTAAGLQLSFDTLTNNQVLAALNGNGTTGTAAIYAAVADTSHANPTVGTDARDSMLLIENVDNLGEYKVYNVEYTDAGGNTAFTSATLVGTIDFGNSVDLVDANVDTIA